MRLSKRLIVLVEPKLVEGHDKNISGHMASLKFVPAPLQRVKL